MSHKIWELNHILKLHNITIAELFQVISSFLLFSFSAIFYIQKKVCLDTTIPCNALNTRSLFFKVGDQYSCSRLVDDLTVMYFSSSAISLIHKSVKIP